MKELLWSCVAKVVTIPWVKNRIINYAKKNPYFHIADQEDPTNIYMYRWWVFNPYDHKTRKPKFSWVPFNIRIHRIMVPDSDRHLHDHPWDARTIILEGEYLEEKPTNTPHNRIYRREPGDSMPLKCGEYHRIAEVSKEGVYTLFITGKHQEDWGFFVDGKKVHWKEYLYGEKNY